MSNLSSTIDKNTQKYLVHRNSARCFIDPDWWTMDNFWFEIGIGILVCCDIKTKEILHLMPIDTVKEEKLDCPESEFTYL